MLGGFAAAVRLGYEHELHCILCIAENSIGPAAFRNDDVIVFKSGKSSAVRPSIRPGQLLNCECEGEQH